MLVLTATTTAHAAPVVALAAGGRAAEPVVTAATTTPGVKELSITLAQYLSRIGDAKFEVQTGDGARGIAVGTMTDFPSLNLAAEFDAADPRRREEYVLRSHAGGVYLIGATELAVRHAVWDFLYRLGYRQFFPGKHWEVVPHSPDLKIAVDVKEKPDFYARRIWYGFGNWKDTTEDKIRWDARNRMASGLSLSGGHAWDGIYNDRKAEFDAHPEYLMSRHPAKFCVSNPGLRKLVVDWALAAFERSPGRDFISLEPSDGDGWDNVDGACRDGVVYKSVSDRVVTLANAVAEAVNRKYKNKYVGIYAYYKHSPPPTIKVDPHVAVGIATSFIHGGYTFEQLVKGWSDQGAVVGVRDYYSVVIAHKDRPGGPQGSDFYGMAARIKKQYSLGARFMSAESSDSWGPAGLGYYIASRMLWNTKENADAIITDFLGKSFGPASEPMRRFYEAIDRGNRPLITPDLIGRMYRDLDEARRLTDDPSIRARLDDLVLYTRYVEILRNLRQADGTEQALRQAYRIRSTHMVHSYALWRDTRGGFTKPAGDMRWSVPEGRNPWKNSAPFSAQELEAFIRDGIAGNPLMPFKPVAFGDDLVPATKLHFPPGEQGQHGYTRGGQVYYVWFDAPGTLRLTVTGGQIAPLAQTTLYLFAMGEQAAVGAEEGPEPAAADEEKPVSMGIAPNDKAPHIVELKAPAAGLYRILTGDKGKGAEVVWPTGTKVAIPSGEDRRSSLRGRLNLYFYVPKGTKVLGGYGSGRGMLLNGSGQEVPLAYDGSGYFSIPVPPGQDGKLWKFSNSDGLRLLMTVPPFLFGSPDEALLPKDVVEADAATP